MKRLLGGIFAAGLAAVAMACSSGSANTRADGSASQPAGQSSDGMMTGASGSSQSGSTASTSSTEGDTAGAPAATSTTERSGTATGSDRSTTSTASGETGSTRTTSSSGSQTPSITGAQAQTDTQKGSHEGHHGATAQPGGEQGSTHAGHDMQKSGTAMQGEKLTDEILIAKLHAANQAEIKMGQLAQQRGKSSQVKRYGKQLVTDHTKADAKLKKIAKAAGVKVDPNSEDAREDRDQAKETLAELKTLKGAEFDARFMEVMEQDHQKVIELVRSGQDQAENEQLKEFLGTLLPSLEKHEQMAKTRSTGAMGRTTTDRSSMRQSRMSGSGSSSESDAAKSDSGSGSLGTSDQSSAESTEGITGESTKTDTGSTGDTSETGAAETQESPAPSDSSGSESTPKDDSN